MIPEDLKKTEQSLLRYRDRISNLSKDFEIGLFIYLFGKVKWLIVLSFLTLFFGAFIYMRYTPKMYETNTTIQINIKEQPDEFLDIYSYQQQTNINSEVELMKSQKIINKTSSKNSTCLSDFLKRNFKIHEICYDSAQF